MSKPLRILYAEDQPLYAQALGFELETGGHTVEIAGDGQQALERITADPADFDLVIIDDQMPRMDGTGLVTGLRALSFPGRIVVYSSRVGLEASARYRALWVDLIVPKGGQSGSMRSLVEQIFTRATSSAGTDDLHQPDSPR